MPTIVAYDIETVPLSPDMLTPVTQARLTKQVTRLSSKEPDLSVAEGLTKAASLHPVIGMICAIG
ncbi:MAG: exonuclease, partial [Myxococcota bacterium]